MLTALFLTDGSPPSDALLRVLRRLGAMERLDLPWPETSVHLRNGEPELICADLQMLQTKLGNRGGDVEAFYLGDLDVLAKLDGNSLVYGGERFQFTWAGRGGAIGLHPYAHRLITMSCVGPAVTGGIQYLAHSEAVPREGRLLFAPVAVSVTSSQADTWTFDSESLNAVVLPPFRTDDGDGYFRLNLRRARSALAQMLENEGPRVRATTLFQAWRLADSPEVRPFLVDGGHLEVAVDVDMRTQLAIAAYGGEAQSDTVAAYRHRFFLEPPSRSASWWSHAIRSSLRHDLDTIVPPGDQACFQPLTMVNANHGCDWSDHPLPEYTSGDGARIWDAVNVVLSKLGERLDSTIVKDLQHRILYPARPGVRGGADDDLAVMAFMRDLLRCAWDPMASSRRLTGDDESWHWRYALLDAVLSEQELRPWQKTGEFVVQWSQSGLEFEVAFPTQRKRELLYWRLLAPVGTRFIDSDVSVLGEPDTMRLDCSLRLN